MAISTKFVFLMKKCEDDTYEKLIDIKDFPDLGGAPEMLETTTLSDYMQKYIPGIESNEGLEFTANYTKADYAALKEFEDEEVSLAIWFGGTKSKGIVTPTGNDGKFTFTGRVSVYITGGGTNEVVGMTISIAPSSALEIAE